MVSSESQSLVLYALTASDGLTPEDIAQWLEVRIAYSEREPRLAARSECGYARGRKLVSAWLTGPGTASVCMCGAAGSTS